MAGRDYYEVLGVPRSASAEDIRRAYRDLARKHHPDVNKSPDSQAKFTEIQEAYDILSDEEKRRLYDAAGHAGVRGQSWGSAGGTGTRVDFDLDELGSMFEAFFGGRKNAPGGASPWSGAGQSGPGARARPRAASPEPVRQDLSISFLTAVRGGTQSIELVAAGKPKSIQVTIPPGIEEGGKLRVRGGAGAGRDVILTVHIGNHPVFRRAPGSSKDLEFDLPLSIAEATLGVRVSVPTLTGHVELNIPPGTGGGRKLRLRGRGIKPPKGDPGDLYAVVRIVAPEAATLTDEQRRLLAELGATQPSPRQGDVWNPGWAP